MSAVIISSSRNGESIDIIFFGTTGIVSVKVIASARAAIYRARLNGIFLGPLPVIALSQKFADRFILHIWSWCVSAGFLFTVTVSAHGIGM